MDYTALVLSLRECSSDSFFYTCKSISTYYKNICNASVFQIIKGCKSEFSAFILTYFYAENFLDTVRIDAKSDIRSLLTN